MIKINKTIWDVDFDDEQEIKLPLSNRQSIAILLGAGFLPLKVIQLAMT